MKISDTIYCLGCIYRTDLPCSKRSDASLVYGVMVNRTTKPPYKNIIKRIIPLCYSQPTHVLIPAKRINAEGNLL